MLGVEGYVQHLMYAPNSPVQDLFSDMSKGLRYLRKRTTERRLRISKIELEATFDFNERMPEEGFLYRCYSADCARWTFKVSGEVIDWLCDTLSIVKPVRHSPWPLGGDSH